MPTLSQFKAPSPPYRRRSSDTVDRRIALAALTAGWPGFGKTDGAVESGHVGCPHRVADGGRLGHAGLANCGCNDVDAVIASEAFGQACRRKPLARPSVDGGPSSIVPEMPSPSGNPGRDEQQMRRVIRGDTCLGD